MQEIVQLEDVPYKQTTVLVYETTFSVMTRLTECSRHVEWRGWSVLSGNFGVREAVSMKLAGCVEQGYNPSIAAVAALAAAGAAG